MDRLKVFEGIPPPYDKKQRMVVPQALRVLRLKPGRKYCTVGRLAHEVGWKYQDVVARYASHAFTHSAKAELQDVHGWLTVEQTRGEKKGQGQGLLREKEGCSTTTRRSTEIIKQRDEAEVGRSRLLEAFRLRKILCDYPANYLRLIVFIGRKRSQLRHPINSREDVTSLWVRWRYAVWYCPTHSGERRAGPISKLMSWAVKIIFSCLGIECSPARWAVMHAE